MFKEINHVKFIYTIFYRTSCSYNNEKVLTLFNNQKHNVLL